MNAGILAEAAGLFAAANVDELVILSLFFGRSAGQPGAARRVVAGQYLGYTALLVITGAVAYGATFLPESFIAYLGFLPLGLGLWAAWQAWRDRRGGGADDTGDAGGDEPTGPKVLTVAAVAFANGSDDIAVYAPVFASTGAADVGVYVAVFAVLTGVWCAAGWFFATREAVTRVIERWGHVAYPAVLIALGLYILVSGGAFGL